MATYMFMECKMMKDLFGFSKGVTEIDKEVLNDCKDVFSNIDSITEYNQAKVLKAFINAGVSETHFAASTGYGYGDRGREVLEEVFAECVGAEDALIRHNFVSGTHTLTVGLFGLLRPGDKMLCATGTPYDTLIGVLGIGEHTDGSLKDFGVEYAQVDLKEDLPDLAGIEKELKSNNYRMLYIQRSRGYSLRPSLTVAQIGEIIKIAKEVSPNTIVFVDNCYGEFVEETEPTSVGADIIAGSLIKNPGGAIAPTGGYIAGKHDLVEKCAARLTCPGVGREVGCTLGHTRELFMGLFNAPHVVGEALKTAVYTAGVFSKLGYFVTPAVSEKRADIIQAVKLETPEALIAFCKGVQAGAPIDSFVVPEPWDMPGYDSKVIMAAGAFTQGASIELSADAPLREPFAVWLQGGINFHSAKIGIMLALESMIKDGVLKL